MSKSTITIRDAQPGDIAALTLLMNDLGYPTTLSEMQTRFSAIAAHPDYKTIVADINNEVVGMAGLCKGIYYEKNGNYMRVLALVTKNGYRELGIGKALLNAAEAWAIAQGLHTVIILSGNRDERQAAHLFYQKMGYTIKSSGFVKQL